MSVFDLLAAVKTQREVLYTLAKRHDHYAELEQLAWKAGEDEAGIEAGDICRLILRAYKAEQDNPEPLEDHVLNLPRWRSFPIGAAK